MPERPSSSTESPLDLKADLPKTSRKRMTFPQRILVEQGTLLLSMLKWTVLASVVGILVGGATALFLNLLQDSIGYMGRSPWLVLLLPVAFFISTLVVRYAAPDAEGHGTERVIYAVHQKEGQVDPVVVPVKLFATIVTIAAGGSAGKEGPCAQIGAGLASTFSNLIRLPSHDRKKLVICGIAAGFAGVFGTPVAGALFAVEVLFLGQLLYDILYPSFVAGIIGYYVTSLLGISYFHHTIRFVPALNEMVFAKVLLAGLFFGMVALLLNIMLQEVAKGFHRFKIWAPWRGALGGFSLLLLAGVAGREYLGLGLTGIEGAVQGHGLPTGAFFWKSLATALTLGSGGSGGIITPLFYIGAAAGDLWGRIVSMDRGTFAAIGMVAVLAGATNTPIAASVMAIELFGPALAPYASVACVVSFLITGHRSVYPSQIIGVAKSKSLEVTMQTEIGQIIEVRRIESPRKLVTLLLKTSRSIQKRAYRWFKKKR